MESTQTQPIRNKKILPIVIVACIILIGVVAGGVFLYLKKSSSAPSASKAGTNSVVEGYKQQLPELAKKAEGATTPTAYRDYAVALYATGDLQKAHDQYEQALKLNANDATLNNNIGNVDRDLGKYDDAIAAYQKAISLNPKAINPYVNLANLYIFTLSKPELGITVYKNALVQNPDNVDLQIQLGVAYEQAKNTAEAAKIYSAILKTSPTNAAALAGASRVSAGSKTAVKASPTATPNSTSTPSASPATKK